LLPVMGASCSSLRKDHCHTHEVRFCRQTHWLLADTTMLLLCLSQALPTCTGHQCAAGYTLKSPAPTLAAGATPDDAACCDVSTPCPASHCQLMQVQSLLPVMGASCSSLRKDHCHTHEVCFCRQTHWLLADTTMLLLCLLQALPTCTGHQCAAGYTLKSPAPTLAAGATPDDAACCDVSTPCPASHCQLMQVQRLLPVMGASCPSLE
jgi:hypothetical protein